MKRTLITFLAVLALWPTLRADRFTDLAQQSLNWIKEGCSDSLLAHSSAPVQAALTPAMISGLWTQLRGAAGELREEQPWKSEQEDGLEIRSRLLVFERVALNYQAVFNTQGLLEGLNFTPAAMPETNATPDTTATAPEEGIVERPFTVAHGDVSLPGTLTLPADVHTPVPAVVLVHGTGPSDRDETMGPNKFFRSLAHALARQGIASLRYDKRTYVYRERTAAVSGGSLTYLTETVYDAQQALRQLAAEPAIDSTRLFVVGHSQGGTLLPLIAQDMTPRPAGLIALAALARPFWQAVHEQLVYVNGEKNDSLVAATEAQLRQSLPAEYLAYQAQYDPLRTARSLGQLPMLFIQGGHDYQVTHTDLELWTKALRSNKHAQFVYLPELDHLMRALPARAVPEDYLLDLPLDNEAVQVVTEFVNHH